MEPIKNFFKKYFNKNVLLNYIYGEFAGRFLGFVVGMWAVSLVAHFFEYPSFKNLWGLNSRKTMVSKNTFEELKWITQVVIGFFVFEIFHKTILGHAPEYYRRGINYLKEKGIIK